MSAAPHRSVRDAPSKPLVVFDGDCNFCRRWVERWREMTQGLVEYAPFQEVAPRFPEIPPDAFAEALHFIDNDGTVYRGAEAVFRSLGSVRGGRALIWGYEHLPGFAPVTETGYRAIASNRMLASFFTRQLWGSEVRRPTYFKARDLFLRALGAIYLIAFLSLWVQVTGLIGERGILPVGQHLQFAREQWGAESFFFFPTLCWLNSTDAFLHFLCGAGAFTSILLMAGLAPGLSLSFLFALYLSLTVAGQTFLSFQWDILLLEAGFLAIFFTPWRWRMDANQEAPLSRPGLFLLKLLLFKLMFMSGVVKLSSHDSSWWDLTALNYHYWTQPLPTVLGWWSDQHPEWFKKFSVAFCLFVEIVLPFFIWAPRRLRHIAAGLLIALQVVIAATGNYCFFNLLTIALCLPLFDDRFLGWPGRASRAVRGLAPALRVAGVAVLILTVPINAMFLFSAIKPEAPWPRPLAALVGYLAPFHVANGYGLFRVMTKSRPEIVIEGSANGEEWRAYEFKWKPGLLEKSPGWVAPHQPRLDWQMWFAALGSYRENPWFVSLLERLLRNTPEVTRLLARNPFPETPPRYVRARVYEYRFTTGPEHRATRAWWKREEQGEYLPAISLENFDRR